MFFCLTIWLASKGMGMVACPVVGDARFRPVTFCARRGDDPTPLVGSFLADAPCDEACRARVLETMAPGFRDVPCSVPQS